MINRRCYFYFWKKIFKNLIFAMQLLTIISVEHFAPGGIVRAYPQVGGLTENPLVLVPMLRVTAVKLRANTSKSRQGRQTIARQFIAEV